MNVSLSLSPDLAQLQARDQLREVLAGVAQLDRGDIEPLDMDAIKAAARQRFLLESQLDPA